MAVYGAKVYGSFKYGIVSTTDISVYPFTASSFNYGSISLSWVYPTSAGDFSSFVLVRNPSGFPTTVDNGDVIYSTTKTALQTAGVGGTSLLGKTTTLTDSGRFYSRATGTLTPTYSGTVSTSIVNSNTFSLTTTNSNIQPGQIVSGYSGIIGNTAVKSVDVLNGVSVITLDTNATIPAGTSVVFSTVGLTPGKAYYYSAFILTNSSWVRVGTAIGTSIKDYNTATMLYQSLPEVYTSALDISSSKISNQNTDLFNFLRTVAVEHDLIKTKVENAKNRYDVLNLDGKLIPALMDQMGFTYESSLGLQQARRVLNYADYIYLNKGTVRGLLQFVSAYSGYNASIAPIKNLFLTLDCASFETGVGFWSASGQNAIIQITNTVAEGGAPAPYYENGSPTGYPNSASGYLKLTATASSSTYSMEYAVSPDKVLMSNTFANDYATGYSFLTFATDTDHGFKTGQSVVIQGMSPNYVNGIWQIIDTPTLRTFTVKNDSATSLISIAPINNYGTVALYSPELYGIPVTAGEYYSFSLYTMANTDVRSVTLGVEWYDRYGTKISDVSDVFSNTLTFWSRIFLPNKQAPTNAVYAVPFVSLAGLNNNEVHYFDALQFEKNTTYTTYSDPRRVDIYLNAPRINHIKNPGFETNTANWTTTGTSAFGLDSSDVYPTSSVGLGLANSTNSAKLTANGSTSALTSTANISVEAGYDYTVSAYIKGAVTNTVVVSITWKTSGGSTISTSSSTSSALSTSFNRFSLTSKAPSTAATATVAFSFTGANGNIYYVDSVLFEKDYLVNDYFDGSTGYLNTDDLIWEQNAAGTAGTSSTGRSLYYPNRFAVQGRLGSVLPDYLPIGTSWALFIGRTAT